MMRDAARRSIRRPRLVHIVTVSAIATLAPMAPATPLNPNSYSSLGTFALDTGNAVFDTTVGNLRINGATTIVASTILTQSNGVQIVVYDFDSISVATGTQVKVVGSRAAALLSRGGVTIAGGITASGVGTIGGGGGGTAGFGGSSTTDGGNGGNLGGGHGDNQTGGGGGGAGFGGVGGQGGRFASPGFAYGPDLWTAMYAGSGGGGGDAGASPNAGTGGFGGAGGGGVELGAVGDVVLTSAGGLIADGGHAAFGQGGGFLGGGGGGGGGGSGGAWLVHGNTVSVPASSVAVRGGNGGNGGSSGGAGAGYGGGAGAGGRIVVMPDRYTVGSVNLNAFLVAAGIPGSSTARGGFTGMPGTIALRPDATSVPTGQSLSIDGGNLSGTAISFSTNQLEVLGTASATLTNTGLTLRALTGIGSVTLAGATTLALGADDGSGEFAGVLNGTGTIRKIGSGVAQLGGNIGFNGALAADAGVLGLDASGSFSSVSVAAGAKLSILGGGRVLTTGSLSMNATGVLDLLNNSMVVDYPAGGSSFGTVKVLVASGCNGGSWNGAGINSSVAAASTSPLTAVGMAESSDLFSTFPATFRGQTVDGSAVLLRHTLTGDSDLSGTVDLTDFTYLAANFNGTGKRWIQGDYNYDGNVDLTDFTYLASNFNQAVATEAAGVGTRVPEPTTTTAVLTIGVTATVAQRRRGRRRCR